MRKRILIVDDEKNIRVTLDQALVTSGYDVITAIDGEHALEKLREAHADLMLLDMKMPGIDGVEVLRRLRTVAPRLPVVMITAHGTVETAVEAMKLGAVDYLRKPFTPDEIRSVVGKVLTRQTLSTETPAESVEEVLEQAKLLLNRSEFEQAGALLQHAQTIDPASAETLNLLGVYYELRGRNQEAARMYRAALSFRPSYSPAIDNLSRASTWPYNPAGVDKNLAPKPAQEAQ